MLQNQKRFKLDLNELKREKWEHKSEEQKSVVKDVQLFYEQQEKLENFK